MPALYSDILLDHFRHPRNYGDLTAPDISYEDLNPLCGDRIRIEVRLNDSIVEEARFKGDGCAISLAAASLLTEVIRGVTIDELSKFSDDRLIAALESDIKPARIACALLPLEALRAGLKAYTAR
ncbi:MAG TPA: iron-sulfur cluster assembly scaffold protein [Pyrinomonadaceae bacterium]|nr:iron-sulfur cluster assembly scaffold protein [Pyrinomonadaceae bacterium]